MALTVVSRPLVLLIGGLLLLEGLGSGVRLAGLLSGLSTRLPVEIALVMLRAAIGAGLAAGGWFLITRRPAAAPIARGALVASAVLTIFDVGFALAPTNVDPTLRWPTVGIYWGYAAAVLWLLRRFN